MPFSKYSAQIAKQRPVKELVVGFDSFRWLLEFFPVLCRYLALVGESAQRPEEGGAIDGNRDRKDVDVCKSKYQLQHGSVNDYFQ
ncbi:hypothetical protein K470DRAFT_67736 [Piedraia hortae CBS 480.64]|uniref:Uncharacterized protein n=1 Tax=Piedraia hortae CBS 480.64 TaxID=1314780 RepID=A0A6A7BZ72_9PEZI|nr:hypothetical protein K470DRAFT_67736 [Piedraia hortae CBS 480.64]